MATKTNKPAVVQEKSKSKNQKERSASKQPYKKTPKPAQVSNEKSVSIKNIKKTENVPQEKKSVQKD